VAEISAKDVKALRDLTGAGMMACKNALAETGGKMDEAVELLRTRNETKAEKRSGNEAREGVVQSYIHSGSKIGVLVEVDTETDFVARNAEVVGFTRDLALHIAAASPLSVTEEDVPAAEREREQRIATEQAADKPENVRERIVTGKVEKWLDEVVLLRQTHVNEDRYGGKTIEEIRAQLAAKFGENIVVNRFARFSVGG
jgi:elongation factor Ts